MGSIHLNSVGHTAAIELFRELTFTIGAGDRVGLVAGNGAGKTTLLRCLAGEIESSAGEIVRSRGLRVGYVEQDVPERLRALALRAAILDALPPDARETDGWRADVVLDGFETPEGMRERLVSELSGGWQRLMLIARIWVNEPDALLLDEPTNHLDLGKILLLERWLNAEAGNMPVVIASHDRAFLDATTNRTLFLRSGTSHFFTLPFSRARAALAEADLAAQRQQERDLKEAQQLRKQAAKLTNIGINSGSDLLTVKSKQLRDRAAKIEASMQELHKERSGEIRLANSGTHAKVMLAIEDLTVSTPVGEPLFAISKLHLFQGDRVVLLGRNGAGKSQLMKMLRRAMEQPGGVPGIRVSPSIRLGYSDQEMSQLPDRGTPFDFIAAFGEGDQRTKALLAAAGFPIEKQSKPIGTLSFGQRARLGLLALRLSEPNFYLMDEPTNHVDIAGQERLEEEILLHEASCILVSHDRGFVRALGTRFLEIEGRRLVEVDGPEGLFARAASSAGA
ncbi:MAG TPA: ABC-F family ATP-binding cassette domain-containing protein [Devosia sp.]|nr:ABC-F family ATP-binding cassette domain-containing protein [Devosia sp.]